MNKRKRFYAGIGAQLTPKPVCRRMTAIAVRLRERGYILRSGAADGADTAFELGAGEDAEIYLPEPRFRGHRSPLYRITDTALELAERFHPAWHRCSPRARNFHARNCYQVLGYDLETPVEFVVCWTADGKASGGTGQAIRIATAHSIPVFNLFDPGALDRLGLLVRAA